MLYVPSPILSGLSRLRFGHADRGIAQRRDVRFNCHYGINQVSIINDALGKLLLAPMPRLRTIVVVTGATPCTHPTQATAGRCPRWAGGRCASPPTTSRATSGSASASRTQEVLSSSTASTATSRSRGLWATSHSRYRATRFRTFNHKLWCKPLFHLIQGQRRSARRRSGMSSRKKNCTELR